MRTSTQYPDLALDFPVEIRCRVFGGGMSWSEIKTNSGIIRGRMFRTHFGHQIPMPSASAYTGFKFRHPDSEYTQVMRWNNDAGVYALVQGEAATST